MVFPRHIAGRTSAPTPPLPPLPPSNLVNTTHFQAFPGQIPPPGSVPVPEYPRSLVSGAPTSWAVPVQQLPPISVFTGAKVGSLANVGEDGSFLSAKGYPTQLFPVMPWASGFAGHHDHDAHTCCYAIKHLPTGQFIPDSVVRMSKPGLALAHALRDGSPRKISLPAAAKDLLTSIEPMGTMLLIDLDNEGHQAWSPLIRERAQHLLADAAKKDPLFASPSIFHTTRGGMRLVWLLSEPVPVEGRRGLEDLLCGLIMRARQAGLEADASCGDWTRLFRLPLVTRPTKDAKSVEQTWIASSLAMSWGDVNFSVKQEQPVDGTVLVHHPDRFKALSEYTRAEIESGGHIVTSLGKLWERRIEREPSRSVTTLLDIETGSCPDAGQVADFVQNLTSEGQLDYNSIKTWVKGRAYPAGKNAVPDPTAKFVWDQLYGTACLVEDPKVSGQLHANLLTLTNRLAWVLRQRLSDTDVSPQMLYLLCIQAARKANQKRKDAGAEERSDEDLEREVWSAVESAYRMRASEQKSFAEQKLEDAACAQEKALLAGRLRTTMEGAFKEYLKGNVQRGTKEAGIGESDAHWIEQNWEHLLILDTPDGFAVAMRDRYGEFYYSHPSEKLGGVLSCVRDSGHDLVDLYKPPMKPLDPPIFKSLAELQYQYGSTLSEITLDRSIPTNRIRLKARGDKLEPELEIAVAGMRTDIEPIRDRAVEQWLQHLGGEHVEKLLDWLATFTHIQSASAGLYIQGAPSIGKGMLGRALTQMTQAQSHGKLEHVMQQFQDSMFRTPFVWGDEEATSSTKASQSMMNLYKKLVSGDFDSLNPKGKTERTVRGYWRVYLSANTDKYLKMSEDVSDADTHAIVVRTLHIKADSAACTKYLTEIGGISATAGWPEHNIPCHIAWLAATRQVALGGRFAVEGVRTDYHDGLSINTNAADLTLRAIAEMLNDKAQPRYNHAFQVRARRSATATTEAPGAPDFCLFVRHTELHRIMIKVFSEDRSVHLASQRAVKNALQMLCGGAKDEVVAFDSPQVEGKQRAWPVPLAGVLKSMETTCLDISCRAAIGEAAWAACATKTMREAQEGVPAPKQAAAAIQFQPIPGISPPRSSDSSNSKFAAPLMFPTQVAIRKE